MSLFSALSWTNWLPVLIILSSLIPGLLIFATPEQASRRRTILNATGIVVKLSLVALMLVGVSRGLEFRFELPFLPNAPLVLRGDALSLQFVSLSSLLWLATTVYAIGYLEGSPLRSRFFGYFSLCVSATVGIASLAT
jgi:multicomponent Na+:H+ antiporter subunit D